MIEATENQKRRKFQPNEWGDIHAPKPQDEKKDDLGVQLKIAQPGVQLVVSGFDNELITLNGLYTMGQPNHGRPMFTKPVDDIEGCFESCVYYWDDRDGAQFSGWWFAPVVGGAQV